MTENTISDRVAERVQELRKQRGWSARRLAEACAAIGSPQLTESVIANIESGRREDGRRRRDVTVDELIAFANALDVPPTRLFGTTLDPREHDLLIQFESAEDTQTFLRMIEKIFGKLLHGSFPVAPPEDGTDG